MVVTIPNRCNQCTWYEDCLAIDPDDISPCFQFNQANAETIAERAEKNKTVKGKLIKGPW